MIKVKCDQNWKYDLSDEIKTVQLRKCWWVYFDVNGNAPSNADMVPCATKELAEKVQELFAAMKDDGKIVLIVKDGRIKQELPNCSVEGYNFDTYWSVKEGWAEDKKIICSLGELARFCDDEYMQDNLDDDPNKNLTDGIYLADNEDEVNEVEEDEDGDNTWSPGDE